MRCSDAVDAAHRDDAPITVGVSGAEAPEAAATAESSNPDAPQAPPARAHRPPQAPVGAPERRRRGCGSRAVLDANTEPEGVGYEHIANETIDGITPSGSGTHMRIAARRTTTKNQRSRIGEPQSCRRKIPANMPTPQLNLDLRGRPSAGEVLARIRNESRDQSEKGRWFEQLFMRIALQEPEFEVAEIWRWPEWPDREALTGLDGRDIGIDLVAKRTTGEWIAIQCKCYDERHILAKAEIDKFLGGSQNPIFRLRWAVATCRWGPNAQRAILNAQPPVTQVDFNQYLAVQVEEETAERPIQQPWPLQEDAIEDTVAGLGNHDRGRLVMACGTGKTFTSLRIAQNVVDDGGRILFAAPTIALVSQARREWLRQTTRPLKCIVVCSDSTAGGRNENEDMRVSELECPVTTNPAEIAQALSGEGPTRVVFCTYHSLGRVTDAQEEHKAPAFDLAIADEAHRTTGALIEGRTSRGRKVNFQEFHDDVRLRAHKRLYMTATPRLYTERSKGKLAAKGITVVDMGDYEVYGPELHRLPFKKAVDAKMLSDYRVIVLGVNQSSVTPGLRRRLAGIETAQSPKKRPNTNDMTRVLGVSLAVNGVTEGKTLEQPGKLQRTLAFANSIARSKWYAEALMESEVLRSTTRRMKDGRAMSVIAKHLDASATALVRNRELRALANAGQKGECRILSNVKLFTEGVDVPQLDAVAFIDPRDSQVDVVQAVGRVMRKAPGKRFGYIIIPVVVEPGQDVAEALMRGTDGYQTVGRVLRALQAHDGRLAESPATFVKIYEEKSSRAPGDEREGGTVEAEGENIQRELELKEAEQGIYAHVAAASGLGKPGQLVADEIADSVKAGSAVLQDEELEDPLAEALDLTTEADGGAKGDLHHCRAAALQRLLVATKTARRTGHAAHHPTRQDCGCEGPERTPRDRMGDDPREGLRAGVQTRPRSAGRAARQHPRRERDPDHRGMRKPRRRLAERTRVRPRRTAVPPNSGFSEERRCVLHEQPVGDHARRTGAHRRLRRLVRPRSGREAEDHGPRLRNRHAADGHTPDHQGPCHREQRDE